MRGTVESGGSRGGFETNSVEQASRGSSRRGGRRALCHRHCEGVGRGGIVELDRGCLEIPIDLCE